MLRQAAEFGEGEDEGDYRDDEEQRLAQDQQQNSRTQDRSHQQINQNRQSKIHGCNYRDPSAMRKVVTHSSVLENFESGCLPAQVSQSHVKTLPGALEIAEARGHFCQPSNKFEATLN